MVQSQSNNSNKERHPVGFSYFKQFGFDAFIVLRYSNSYLFWKTPYRKQTNQSGNNEENIFLSFFQCFVLLLGVAYNLCYVVQ